LTAQDYGNGGQLYTNDKIAALVLIIWRTWRIRTWFRRIWGTGGCAL